MSNPKIGAQSLRPAGQAMPFNSATGMPDNKRAAWFNLPFILLSLGFILFGILSFNVKMSLMGDDANYILDGYNFMHRHTYPGQSSLYGMLIGVIELFTGTNVLSLKICSFIFAFIGFVTLYRIGFNRIDRRILYPVLIFSAINSNLQYFSSSNLSEAFYMMLQYLYTGFVFLFLDRLSKEGQNNMGKYWLALGFMGLLMSLGKNIAIVAPMAIVVYFICYKQWRFALKAFAVFLLFKVPYEVMLRLVYKNNTGVGQLDQVLAKQLYHHEAGRETLGGFGVRFVENAQIYFAQVSLKEFGLVIGDWRAIATILISALLIFATVQARKKNKYIFFIGLYTGIMCVTTFLALQADVAQDRIIIIVLPYLLLLLLFALLELMARVNKKMPSANPLIYYLLLAGMAWSNLARASEYIRNNLPVLQENIAGDDYAGFTPDWVNYLEMGKWVTAHLPANEVVAARKANPLSVYCNGRDFYGIYSFPTNLNSDQILDKLKKDKVNYMILASLRGNPMEANPASIITTLHNYCAKIVEKYPEAIKIVHTIGKEEPCYLVQIIYPEKWQK